MADGRLLHLRDTYPSRPPQPRYVAGELRQVRAAAWDAGLAGLRASAEARASGSAGAHDRAAAQRKLAVGYQVLERAYGRRETVFAQTMADRADWDKATRAQRQLAVAADAELRRRYPRQYFAPLRSAEPEPATQTQRATACRPETSHPARSTSGSRTWPPGTGPSPTGSPTGRARRSRPRIPATATSARRSPPDQPAQGPICSRPSPEIPPSPRMASNAR